jgi:DNA-binding CsgD family transcriptional regulator
LDFLARGKLADARAAIRAALEEPDVRVATAAIALLAPFVADALDDDTIVTPEIEGEFARTRARADHVDDAAILGAAAFWSLRRGERAAALNDLRRALDCLSGPVVHLAPMVMLAAEQLPIAELDRLDRFCDPSMLDPDDALGRAHALAIAAIVAGRRGDENAAAACGSSAVEIYRQAGRPLAAARAAESAGNTREARALYERCGAVGWLKRLDAQRTPAGAPEDALSNREREVARLIADGLNNVAIGERLSISTKTVEKHVASIYDKLGVRSRPQVALLVSGSAGIGRSA